MKTALLTGIFLFILFKLYAQEKLPSFRYADINGKYTTSAEIVLKKPAVLIYFDPECEECQQFTTLIAQNSRLFTRYKIIMVTNAGLQNLKRFVSKYKLAGKQGLIIGTEGWTRDLQRTLNVTGFPFVAIYDRKRILRQVLSAKAPGQLYKQLEELSIK